jgi:hypothetical protein
LSAPSTWREVIQADTPGAARLATAGMADRRCHKPVIESYSTLRISLL